MRPSPLMAWALLLAAAGCLRADARTSYYEGQIALEEGRYTEAGRAFAKAGQGGYPAPKVHLGMGQVYLALGQPSRAIEHLAKVLEAGEGDDTVRANLARAQAEIGKDDEALATMEPLFAPDREPEPSLRLLKGKLLLARRQYMPAYDQLSLAVPAFPDEVLELAEKFPMEMDEALHELAREAASAPPAPKTTSALAAFPTTPIAVPGLNRVGGVVGPLPTPLPDNGPVETGSKTGGPMHVIKGKASRGTKVNEK